MKDFTRTITRKKHDERGQLTEKFTVNIRFNDECRNGHQSLGITADWMEYEDGRRVGESYGQLNDEVKRVFPELSRFLKWHLTSTDEPMHYKANTVYHAQNGDLNYARSTAVWPDATLEQLKDARKLMRRLPALLKRFMRDMSTLSTLELKG